MKNKITIIIYALLTTISPLLGACSSDDKKSGEDLLVGYINSMDFSYVDSKLSITLDMAYSSTISKMKIDYRQYIPASDEQNEWTSVTINGPFQETTTQEISVPQSNTYEIRITLINAAGVNSIPQTKIIRAYTQEEMLHTPLFDCANEQMKVIIDKYFAKSSRTIWQNQYPNKMSGENIYWDGDALVWGQGSGLSAFVAIREATLNTSDASYYTSLDDDIYNGIQGFYVTDQNVTAYSCYPASGNDRFYDDNVWIGLDMANWYKITKNERYLTQAKAVWTYLTEHGWTDTCKGGVLWKELQKPSDGKHTCSTAPTGVLSCRLYEITQDKKYLDWAIKIYNWLNEVMKDPNDHLFYDNVQPDDNNPNEIGKIEKTKYSYNSGQVLQLACMLYKHTQDEKYLTEAKNIANACHDMWFKDFHSNVLNCDFKILSPGSAWFHAVMSRGLFELYSIDKDPVFLNDLRYTMLHAWYGPAHQENGLINDDDLSGNGKDKNSWEILQQGGLVELMARLAIWEKEVNNK
ncbi:glycoside hydrolase family 76 protein [Mediterranea massiliensis]|uniref:glycoside hydrolase family 76 protein n=1 Tax=Mediterranea massiliensis TaxID=1841865 RepID=UPI0025A482FC|nr:glycoside hydrolase family 76 protein [Mediterranea massiliensis]MDM8338150.1 glycoside hydrolase family 76 protein [Mediterranea massiliensis]